MPARALERQHDAVEARARLDRESTTRRRAGSASSTRRSSTFGCRWSSRISHARSASVTSSARCVSNTPRCHLRADLFADACRRRGAVERQRRPTGPSDHPQRERRRIGRHRVALEPDARLQIAALDRVAPRCSSTPSRAAKKSNSSPSSTPSSSRSSASGIAAVGRDGDLADVGTLARLGAAARRRRRSRTS